MVVWDEEAVIELQKIYDYIYKNSPQNAELVVSELLSLAERAQQMPFKNPKDPFCENDNIRFIPKWNYKIIYEVDGEIIRIVSVFSTSQNPLKQYKKR